MTEAELVEYMREVLDRIGVVKWTSMVGLKNSLPAERLMVISERRAKGLPPRVILEE